MVGQAKLLELQRELWELDKRPAWRVEMKVRDKEGADPSQQLAQDLDKLKTSVRKSLRRKGLQQRCVAGNA